VKVDFFSRGREREHSKNALEICNKIIEQIKIECPKASLRDEVKKQGGSIFFFLYKKNN
jgi:hypothetical protein